MVKVPVFAITFESCNFTGFSSIPLHPDMMFPLAHTLIWKIATQIPFSKNIGDGYVALWLANLLLSFWFDPIFSVISTFCNRIHGTIWLLIIHLHLTVASGRLPCYSELASAATRVAPWRKFCNMFYNYRFNKNINLPLFWFVHQVLNHRPCWAFILIKKKYNLTFRLYRLNILCTCLQEFAWLDSIVAPWDSWMLTRRPSHHSRRR